MKIIGHLERGHSPCIVMRRFGVSVHLTVDTGFDGELCLNLSVLKKWGFVFKGIESVELADGRVVETKTYAGTIRWFGQNRRVLAHETRSGEYLLGTGLLDGIEFRMNTEKGLVILSKP